MLRRLRARRAPGAQRATTAPSATRTSSICDRRRARAPPTHVGELGRARGRRRRPCGPATSASTTPAGGTVATGSTSQRGARRGGARAVGAARPRPARWRRCAARARPRSGVRRCAARPRCRPASPGPRRGRSPRATPRRRAPPRRTSEPGRAPPPACRSSGGTPRPRRAAPARRRGRRVGDGAGAAGAAPAARPAARRPRRRRRCAAASERQREPPATASGSGRDDRRARGPTYAVVRHGPGDRAARQGGSSRRPTGLADGLARSMRYQAAVPGFAPGPCRVPRFPRSAHPRDGLGWRYERAAVYTWRRSERDAGRADRPPLSSSAAAHRRAALSMPDEDLRRHPTGPRAQLGARRRRGPDPRPPRHPDRRRAARQAQAHLHAARATSATSSSSSTPRRSP